VPFLRAVDKAVTLDAAARLPSLKIPALVAWGQDDRFFTRELGRRLAAVLPGSRLEPIAGARTFVAHDAPADRARAIGAYLRETSAQTAAWGSSSQTFGKTLGGVAPGQSGNSRRACSSVGRPA
jgi:hypothetical protein